MIAEWILTADEASQLLSKGEACLLDVREPDEWSQSKFDVHPVQYYATSGMPSKVPDWKSHERWIVACAHGVRSQMVVEYFRKQGVQGVFSLKGGIAEWRRLGFGVKR